MSDFGPANAIGGVWECPDLFPLAVDGKRKKTKWVLLVNLNPGGIAGGSGVQYFVGDFDGTTFTRRQRRRRLHAAGGHVFADFEGDDYGGWTTTGDAFGTGPAPATSRARAASPATSATGWPTASTARIAARARSPRRTFTITRPYVNFLVGGGAHPHDPATGRRPAAGRRRCSPTSRAPTYGDGWTPTGDFAGTRPPAGTIGDQQPVSGYEGEQLVNTFFDHDNGDRAHHLARVHDHQRLRQLPGRRRQPPVSRGPANPPTAVNLIVDGAGRAHRDRPGRRGAQLDELGRRRVRGQDGRRSRSSTRTPAAGGTSSPTTSCSPTSRPIPRSIETAVNLLVDGQVVRTHDREEQRDARLGELERRAT